MIPDNYEDEDGQAGMLSQPESSRRPQRNHRLPTWLEDYVMSNDNNLSDEEIIEFVLFVDYEPVNF